MAVASETDETRATGGTARATTTLDTADTTDGDADLGAALAAIAADGQRMLAGLTGELGFELAAAIDLARRRLSKEELVALIATLKRSRQATVAASRRRSKADTTGRQAALKRARRRVPSQREPSP